MAFFYRERLQKITEDLAAMLPWKYGDESTEHLQQLAEAFIGYSRMMKEHLELQAATSAVVDARELARRFREPRRTIVRALSLLEADGRAERGDLRHCWKLQV